MWRTEVAVRPRRVELERRGLACAQQSAVQANPTREADGVFERTAVCPGHCRARLHVGTGRGIRVLAGCAADADLVRVDRCAAWALDDGWRWSGATWPLLEAAVELEGPQAVTAGDRL